jgi:hypothetical protein
MQPTVLYGGGRELWAAVEKFTPEKKKILAS